MALGRYLLSMGPWSTLIDSIKSFSIFMLLFLALATADFKSLATAGADLQGITCNCAKASFTDCPLMTPETNLTLRGATLKLLNLAVTLIIMNKFIYCRQAEFWLPPFWLRRQLPQQLPVLSAFCRHVL